ncbi:MAG: hypothetical protein WKF87_15355 [Chryseolinea sp.]
MRLHFLILSIIGVISCTSDDYVSVTEATSKKWTLVSMSGSVSGVFPATGDSMSWQEYYVFNGDMTFAKFRDRDGIKSEAAGTYDSTSFSTENFLELTFTSGTQLVGSCTSSQNTETLFFASEMEIRSTWSQCDGPGLVYRRLE